MGILGSATELNRQPGRVLDRALEHPVTITPHRPRRPSRGIGEELHRSFR